MQNERHELYALHRARGMVPKKAAIAAGFAQGSSIYSSLEDDPEVIQRIAELTRETQLKREQNRAAAIEAARTVGQITGMSKSWVLQQLALNAVAARDDGMFKESNDAIKLIGEEFGMFKGISGNDDSGGAQVMIDLDKTEALLNAASGSMVTLPAPAANKPIDMAMVERLITGNKPVQVRDRMLSTGSETDVALMPLSDIPETED